MTTTTRLDALDATYGHVQAALELICRDCPVPQEFCTIQGYHDAIRKNRALRAAADDLLGLLADEMGRIDGEGE